MRKRRVNFQSIQVKFPKRLYLVTSWLIDSENRKIPFTHHSLYKNPKDGLKGAREIYKGLEDAEVLEWAMINPVDFNRKYHLRKEFWQNPSYPYDEATRLKQFINLYLDYESYELLVTPHSAKLGIFTTPITFKKDTPREDLELFMMTSDWFVDPQADCCAFYTIGETISINIFTGKTYHKDFLQHPKKVVLS